MRGRPIISSDDESGKFRRAGDDQLAAWLAGVESGAGPRRTGSLTEFTSARTSYPHPMSSLTPEQLHPRDRPYAAWSYLGVYREIIRHSNAWMKYGFDLGILGPTAKGRQTQEPLSTGSRTWMPRQPQGWDSQIRDEARHSSRSPKTARDR